MHGPPLKYIHTQLNLEADVGDDIMTYWALIDDTLLSDLLHRRKYAGSVSVNGSRSLQCSHLWAKGKEPTIFRVVSVNRDWHSHRHTCLKHSIQAVKGTESLNVQTPLRATSQKICACTTGSANHWTLTESMGEPHFTWALHRKTNTQQIIKKKICAFFVHYSVKTNNNQRYDFPGFWLCKSQLPINIPSNRNADVPKLCWRHTHEVEHLAKMPTCCAVGCENRTSNVLCWVFQNNSFSEYRQDLVCFNKTDVVCGSILQREDWNATVVKEAHVCRVHLISGKLSFITFETWNLCCRKLFCGGLACN